MSATRHVDSALLAYLQNNGLHMALATKVGPLPDGTYRYFVNTTKNRTFDHGDGSGPQLHYARGGADLSQLVSSAGLGVDNAEAQTLAVDGGVYLTGFTIQQVIAGELDAVPYETRCFCYLDPSLGSFVWASGNLGQVRKERTALINFELTSLSMKLGQVIGQVDSTRCRAIFGSQPIGSGASGGIPTERFPCTYDYSGDWVAFEASALSPDDTDLIFYASDLLAYATDFFAFGMVRCITGRNAGIEREVDTFTNDSIEPQVRLAFAWPYNPEVGDQFEIRPGCSHYEDAAHGCRRWFGSTWPLKIRAEIRMPIGDAAGNLISGAGIPGDIGGTGEPPIPSVPPAVPPSGGAGQPSNVPTPTRTRGATILDVTDYGATGNGVTDDTAAFNSAFNDLPVDGGTVYAPPGVYLIDPDVMIKPVSYSALWLDEEAEIQLSYTAVDHRYGVWVKDKTNFEAFGGTLTGYLDSWNPIPGTTSEWGHGFFFEGSNQCTVRDMTIRKCVGDGVSMGKRNSAFTPDDIIVANCLITECRRQGVTVGRSTDCQVLGNEISYISGTAPEAGVDVEPDLPTSGGETHGVIIDGNHIHHCDGPGVLEWISTFDSVISDNILEFNNNGILTNDSVGGTITGNTIRHNRNRGIRFQSGSSGFDVSGNEFWNNSTGSEGFQSYDPAKVYSRTGTPSPYLTTHIQIESGATANVETNEVGPWPE